MTAFCELWVDGFGCLRSPERPYTFERDRITLFLDDNEAGKTTLQMALLASLYGVEHHRGKLGRKKLLRSQDPEWFTTLLRPHHDHWFPLTGAPFGSRLRIHAGTQLLELRWDFTSDGAFHVVDLDTNTEVTGELCPGSDPLNLGRSILGLTLDEFAKTCLVRQDDLNRVRDSDGLDALVQRAADTKAGDSTVASAQEKLRALLRNYPGVTLKESGLVETEIARLSEEIESLEQKLADLDAEQSAIATADAEFQRLAAEREEQRKLAVRLEYLAQVAEHDELRERITGAEARRTALDELEAERESLAHLAGFPAEQADQLMQWQVTRLGLLHNSAQAERTVAQIQTEQIGPARRELEGLHSLAAVSEDDLDSVAELLGKTRAFEASEQKLLDAMRREEASLATEGASIEELDRLEERFTRLRPEDGQFLTDYERVTAQAASEIAEVKRLALESTMRVDRVMEDRERLRASAHRRLVIGAVAAAAAIVLGGLLAVLNVSLGIGVGLGGVAIGGFLAFRAHRASSRAGDYRSDELAAARLEVNRHNDRRELLASDERDREARLNVQAARFNYEQPEVLIDDFGTLDDLRRLCGTLILLRRQQPEVGEQRDEIEQEVAERFQAFGREVPAGAELSVALVDLQDRMARSLRLRRQIDELTRKSADEAQRRDSLQVEADELTAQVRSLFENAGLGTPDSVEEGISLFNAQMQHYRRLRELADVLIPQARSAVVAPEVVTAEKADLERLHRSIANLREERPSLVALEVTEGSREYRRQRANVRSRLSELSVRADEAGRRVVDVLTRCHAERPRSEEELTERREQLDRARRHQAALAMAIDVLDEIGQEVHGRWAEELNRSTSHLLKRMVPSLGDLKFDSRLCFGVWHRGGEVPVRSTESSPILSTGTWDQLYLAVRLGLADFISRRATGGILMLDDPFAHFDDTRFEAAMHVLGEFASGNHQVLLFSCQRQRFQALRSRDPEWFDSAIAIQNVRPPDGERS